MPDTASFLNDLADSLCGEIAAGAANVLVHVKEADDGYDVGILPLDRTHPTSVLLGAVAPPDWIALGVASRGRPHDMTGDRRRKLPASAAAVVFVHRDGGVIGRMRVGDEEHREPPAYGLSLDCLQRTFGLPTAPPLVGTGARFTGAWLENVLRVAETRWPEVVALHPVKQVFDVELEGLSERELAIATVALERRCDWERLRWLVVEGGWQEPYVTPVDAAWLDAGSFSRLVMADVPPTGRALAEVRRVVGPSIARRCRSVVNQVAAVARRCAA